MTNAQEPQHNGLVNEWCNIIASAMSSLNRTLYCIDLASNAYYSLNDGAMETGNLDQLQKAFSNIVDHLTAAKEHDKVSEFLDIETLAERLALTQEIAIGFENANGGQSHALFIVAEKNPDGKPSKLLFVCEGSAIRGSETDAEHLIDPVTGLLDRKGYSKLKSELANAQEPIALAIIDVDRFKKINETYSHLEGDKILARVADVLRSLIRTNDEVFRIGGDEFAVILRNCPATASEQLITKFKSAHVALSDALTDKKHVTLSVGVCFSPAGINDDVVKNADDAMYEIKGDGRGGCALADENGVVFRKWFNGEVERKHDATFTSTVGSWRIEIPADGSPRRMFCDDSMLRIGGEKRRENPEEMYRRWRNGLLSTDKRRIDGVMGTLSYSGEQSNIAFNWKGENGTELSIVSSAARDRNFPNGECFYGYFDLTKGNEERKRTDELEQLNEALARSLAFGYVVDLQAKTYSTLRRPSSGPLAYLQNDGPLASLNSALVRLAADDDGEKAISEMIDRASIPSRLAGVDHVFCDFLSTGVQGWCRAKLYAFKADGYTGIRKVVLVGESAETTGAGRYVESSEYETANDSGNKARVLVVDDEELNRALLGDALGDDFEVVEATDGAEAYGYVSANPGAFAGIVTDLSMPNMNGEELLVKLEEDGVSSKVPVVVVTAENRMENEQRCLEHGAIDFIRKPFNMPVARRRVNNVVELFKLQNHLRTEVERRTEELQTAYDELEDKSRWLREYAFRLADSSARMIESLGEIVEFRSVEAGTHVARVKQYTNALARHMLETNPECGLTDDKVKLITEASPLHDVGKIAIPDAVLLKPGKLTDEEFEIMKTHTTEGYRLLATLDSAWEDGYRTVCEEICLFHHERYDGLGYPHGLKGEEIPLSAQIVSIADIFDALSSDRVYRPALGTEATRDLIMEGKVGSFSSRMLKCFEETYPELVEISKRIKEGI